ncbi:cytochrome P450 4C1-like isoform X1 [Centruroides sculpturatus]|uniref:cytochrome P450 4C1-like isoform X1 n=1 Tax=Centruroides sculpturatus TaxID=218467 RepID=UPI000C6E3383|nr:cytochrome P450 4C1-like isoform X1 [Centruroides sculpturatus]XP_023211182.1 cytochrome P450 4C1-like isoform X1 [Centruroides sculpturatus]
MITPTFHYRILDQFIPIFDKNSKIFVTNLKEYLDKEWIDVTHLVNLCTLDIISETAMGIEMKSQNKNKGYYLNALQEFCDIFMVRCMKPWLYSDFIFSHTSDGKKIKEVISILHDFTSKILKQRKEELKKEKTREKNCSEICEDKRKEPLLNTLIKYQFENCNFTDKDICEELDTFLFEGHDTTSVGICWVLYYLGLYPNIQQKVYEELLQIFGGDKDRPITTQDIKDMKYLECVLKESQRLSPSVPTITRSCTEDIKINGYTIPRGTTLNLFIYALHRDSKNFPNPEIFDPDRFLAENCIGRHPFAFCPFSAGSRNCIGQKYALIELKAVISRVIMNYRITSIDPPDKITYNFLLVLRPMEGFRLKIRPRE